ncbi:DnaE-like DNA polymerase III [Gordonia phage DalanDe]|nr:DnaE-like DNA polymerase III [Gordonia phage DalanDe]
MPGAVPSADCKFFHAHNHTHYSTLDALSAIPPMVAVAHEKLGHPGVAVTDHGTMGGAVQLYLECKKRDIKAWIGIEGYLLDPSRDDWMDPPKGATDVARYHFGLLALDEEGYKGLVKFSSLTHTRPRFYKKFARCTLADLLQLGADYGDHLVLTTGCFFGLVQQCIARGDSDMAHRYVEVLAEAFPHTFVELQHHNILHNEDGNNYAVETDDDMVEELLAIADALDLPVIATQDSHYLKEKHRGAHTLMKKMVYSSQEDGFPGDSFHLATTEWVAEHYDQDVWDRVEEGFDLLDALHNLTIEPLDNYRPRVPHVSDTPDRDVARQCRKALTRYLKEQEAAGVELDREKYVARLAHELDVIKQLGMSPYFVITADMVRWCQEENICVEARGSANGSLACFFMGITQVDPLIWGGLFERFLSLDRTKPPDVDLDIEDAERGRLMAYLLAKYNAVQIGTYGLLGTRFDPDTGEEKGSILQTWLSSKRTECERIAKFWADKQEKRLGKRPTVDAIKRYGMGVFNNTYGDVETIDDIRDHSESDYRDIRVLDSLKSVYKSYGVHAGGILLPGPGVSIEDYIPTMLVASSDTRVSQYNMDDVEKFGLLKMDVLGQASLRMMKLCQKHIGLTDPTDFSWIPNDDPDAAKLLREGRTKTGLFHFEGYTKSKGGREMKIKTTEDCVLAQALYMPGAMDSGEKDKYIARRFSAAERKKITYLSAEFRDALESTLGAAIFQEQVLIVLRNFGLDMATINTTFAILKDSGRGADERNRERIKAVRPLFDAAVKKRGVDPDEAWEYLAGFAAYGFNRAHASGYGIRSYRTGYLKAHYPTEYMAALLETWAGRDKEADYVREARRIGIRLLPPDVNISRTVWTLDPTRDNVVRRGLLSIKGVGAKAADCIVENAPYASVNDLIERVPGRQMTGGAKWLKTGEWSGILGALHNAGALDELLMDATLDL